MIREYAHSLGKRHFFLFGEVANSDDALYDRYIGPNTSQQEGNDTVFFGIDSLLDFRLADGICSQGIPQLRAIMRGYVGPESLYGRLEAQRNRAVNRGELGRYLVTFVDNHDSFWQSGRFAYQSSDAQVVGAIGFLLCALGTACIYYGTEQGFEGHGGDNEMREAMFDQNNPGQNLLNTNCSIYKAISEIAAVMRSKQPLRFGRMYYRQISGNAQDFGFPFGTTYTLAFSRLLYGQEVLVAYNVAGAARSDSVIVDGELHKVGDTMTYLYPHGKGTTTVKQAPNGAKYVTLALDKHQFAILE
jgi:alpha-amylase